VGVSSDGNGEGSGQTKVRQLDAATGVKKKVLGFEVAV